MLDEAKIISQIKKAFPKYIGDDAAVIEEFGNQNYLISKDLLIEDIHCKPLKNN